MPEVAFSTDEALLYCHSSQRKKKVLAIGQRSTTRFEEALQYFSIGQTINSLLLK